MTMMKENQLYHRHNAYLQEKLNRAKVPEKIWISRSGAYYHKTNCNHCPSTSLKYRKRKDYMP